MTVIFDPFSHTLQPTHRFRLKNNSLLPESRKKYFCIKWLFIRHQYHYTPLLKKMESLYLNAMQTRQEITPQYIENYRLLIEGATRHNDKYKNSWFLFLHKIDLTTHTQRFLDLQLTSGWWGLDFSPQDKILETANFGGLACPYLSDLLRHINPHFTIEESNHTTNNYEAVLKTIGLSTIQDFIVKGLYTRESFETYLKTHKDRLSKLIIKRHSKIINLEKAGELP